MNAGTTLAACVLISARTVWDLTSVAAHQGSSSLLMAGIVMVSHIQIGRIAITICAVYAVGYTLHILSLTGTIETPIQSCDGPFGCENS